MGQRKGHKISPETKAKISASLMGHAVSEETLIKKRAYKHPPHVIAGMIARQTGRVASVETRLKMSIARKGRVVTVETRKKMSASSKKGAESNWWKDGASTKNHLIRQTSEYKLWREAVFMRDNWTCCGCGVRGGTLQAHHIKPFALFPELRFAIDNGSTLCIECHKKTDTYLKPIVGSIPNPPLYSGVV